MEVCAIVASLNVNRFCSFSTSTSSTASGPAEHLASSARLVLPLLLARRPCRERGWGQTEDLALAWCLCGVSEVQVQQEQQQQLQRLPANPKAKLFLATRLVTAKTACFYYSWLPPLPACCSPLATAIRRSCLGLAHKGESLPAAAALRRGRRLRLWQKL